jgi:hypothetical protein
MVVETRTKTQWGKQAVLAGHIHLWLGHQGGRSGNEIQRLEDAGLLDQFRHHTRLYTLTPA